MATISLEDHFNSINVEEEIKKQQSETKTTTNQLATNENNVSSVNNENQDLSMMQEAIDPVLGSNAAKYTLSILASTIALAHIWQGSRVTYKSQFTNR